MKIKTFGEFVNEDITDVYSRLRHGRKRAEDGREVETSIGKVFLKIPYCDYENLIKTILDNSNSDYIAGVNVLDMRYYSDTEIKKLYDGSYDNSYIIDKGGRGNDLVASFDSYNNILDEGGDDILNDICEEDYKSICKLITETLSNIDLEKPKGYQEDYVVYLGDASYVDEFFYDDFEKEFDDNFNLNVDLKFWSYQYDESVGVPICYDSVVKYSEMKEFTKNQIELHKLDDE